MALAPITRWRIHIGAHKTATTHVQETLALLRPGLLAKGVDFIPNRELRGVGVAVALTRRHVEARVPFLRGRMVRRTLDARLAPLRAGPATLVLSEEKLIGGSQHVFSEPIYPQLERTVRLLATLGSGAELTLFLSIRSFDAQLPSAYVQELKYMTPIAGGFENLRRRVLARPPSWFEMVRRIRTVAPGVPLRIWRQEDYRGHSREILSALCGLDVGPPPAIADPARTKSPDLEAIRAAEALPLEMPVAERQRRVREIFAAAAEAEDGGERFQPFTPDERTRLQAAYADDIARIEALDPAMLVRF
jgi:hypothetical protein